MSAVDLVILGFIKKSQYSAYELAQKIEQSQLKKIIKIGSPTVYQNLKKMAKKEYLSTTTIKVGEMPEKTIYQLTDSGEKYFYNLMQQYSSTPGRMYFSFNSFLKNLTLVSKEDGLAMLKNLKLFFYDTKEDLEKDIKELKNPPFEIKAIQKQYFIFLKGLIEWIEEVIEEYKK